jgi:hypothetical protein
MHLMIRFRNFFRVATLAGFRHFGKKIYNSDKRQPSELHQTPRLGTGFSEKPL